MQEAVAADIRRIFRSESRQQAAHELQRVVMKYEESAPQLARWIGENLEEGFSVFDLPEKHRRRLATTNGVERLNKELKRRTRVVGVFPNEASLLRLVEALCIEQSEEWENGKIYLTMEENR